MYEVRDEFTGFHFNGTCEEITQTFWQKIVGTV